MTGERQAPPRPAAKDEIARLERDLWLLSACVEGVRDDLERLSGSRTWRLVSLVAALRSRVGRRRTATGGALASALERIERARPAIAPTRPAEHPPVPRDREPGDQVGTGNGDRALPAGLAVAIAVHDAYAVTRRCLESVVACTPSSAAVIVVDDGSSDPRVRSLLDAYAADGRVRLIRHGAARGYTAAANAACGAAEGDVVLLNSDTEVTPGWLEGLAAVAASRDGVATVTPVSNAAGVFSIPVANADNALPPWLRTTEMGALVRAVSPALRPETPAGGGFCLYVRRAALDAVGGFDEQAFPDGYGEETDFCLRARGAGLVNLVDDATFVHHVRNASIGAATRDAARASARRIVAERHPAYEREIRAFVREDPLGPLRAAVGSALARGRDAVEAAIGADRER